MSVPPIPSSAGPTPESRLHRVGVNGVELNVATAGTGPAVLLLHGFPHTWRLWTHVMEDLAGRYRVIAPDLRGLGASTRAADGYDPGTLAEDCLGLLNALGEESASVMAIDAGVPPAFLMAMRSPGRVRRLVLMESLVGTLPGAERFLAGGPPWWFGFHSVPGLAESVLRGNEAAYIGWFLDAGTLGQGVGGEFRDAFVDAYSGSEALRCAFSYYRAMPTGARQIREAVEAGRLSVPTMAVGAQPVGNALEQQLRPVADDLTGHLVEDCGHIIPLHRPEALLRLVRPFLV
ncbi:Pimeloyl-ACP methyl ester carboxylesterase [Streptomyces sp. LamerLS-316]|uniref:alpha/beta fold hydrolase n=1 Tax=unclassified Streptomyces TaxID=2593676 RepID=UPI000823EC0A|nr:MULTISPECIES: alpha/beta hydrolase [unclassified Streptomyces]MYQ39718.1 alpha/beta fold hydrolase [Streptomyces sp. SID4921]SCK17961.1 Pimeloyl-ACP methyl ester carboxylesterase [Streptomyces sp. LamerLS-316]